MDVNIRVETQYWENYNMEGKIPMWKPKGGQVFNIVVNDDLITYMPEDQIIKVIRGMLNNVSTHYGKYEYRGHEILFKKDITLYGFEETFNELFG